MMAWKAKQGSDNLKFLLVCIEGDKKDSIEAFVKKNKIEDMNEFHCYVDSAPSELGLQYIPHLTLVGADGKVAYNYKMTDAERDSFMAKHAKAAPAGGDDAKQEEAK